MNKAKFYALCAITFVKRQKLKLLLAVIGIILTSVTLIFFSMYYSPVKVVREGIVGTYTLNDLPEVITGLLSTGLLSMDESGQIKPSIIKEWNVNSTGTLYTFKIDDNSTWSDGSKIKSYDIAINIPEVQTFYVNDDTLQVKLSDSYSPFLSLLTKPILKKDTRIGVGPYMIKNIISDPNSSIVKRLELKSKDSYLPDLVINFYSNEKYASNALNLGEIQAIVDAGNSFKENNPTLKVWSKVNYGQIVAIFYDTKDATLSDENLRTALSYATPKLDGEQEAITSIPPISWVFNKDVKSYLNNDEEAKNALKRVQNLDKINITLTATSSLGSVGEKIVQNWNRLGIKANLKVESGIPQSYQALLIAQNIPLDPDQYSLWHSTQTQTNISKISNARLDKDLEDGRKATDSAVRKLKYLDFQKVMADHSPATFLYFPKTNVLYMKKIETDLRKVLELQIP